MYTEFQKTKAEYSKYPPEKKIKVLFGLRNVLNLQLETNEKMSLIPATSIEKKALEYRHNDLQTEVWRCDEEVYSQYDKLSKNNSVKDKIGEEIEDAEIYRMLFGIPELKTGMLYEEYGALSTVEKIEFLDFLNTIFTWELNAIEIKEESLKPKKTNEYERIFLWLHSSNLKNSFSSVYKEKWRLYFYEIPKDYPYRKELREKLQGLKLTLEKRVLKELLFSENQCTIANLTEILTTELPYITDVMMEYSDEDLLSKTGFIEVLKERLPYVKKYLENIPEEEFLCRKEILEEILKIEALDVRHHYSLSFPHQEDIDTRNKNEHPYRFFDKQRNYLYNYEVVNNAFDTYSPKKKIEVGLANHYVLTLLVNAVKKWSISREMNEYEKMISEVEYKILQCSLYGWDGEILTVYYEDLLPDTPYKKEMHKQIQIANIDEGSFKSGLMAQKLNELYSSIKRPNLKLPPHDKIKYLIAYRSLLSAECDMLLDSRQSRKLDGYEKLIIESQCAELSRKVVLIDNDIYYIFNKELPENYPYRKELLKEIQDANVSDKVPKIKYIGEI